MESMKIERIHYEEAYRYGQEVHKRTLSLAEARRHLEKIGLNRNSAADLINNLGHMLGGNRYKRTLSPAATDSFLTGIKRDYGEQALKNAVSAYKQHLEYYQTLTGTPMRDHVRILHKFSDLLKNSFEEFIIAEEIEEPQHFVEGATKTISINIYERSQKARKVCICEYGCICSVCGFDFEKKYGALGKDFIHVHHIRELASIGKQYTLNPKDDLRPVCPNCHAMLHKSKPAYTIAELKVLIKD
ncbi:MAG: endonuclease [Pedosphaera sp.]|nr:endonuclease [Pedosphaera sp.]